MQINTIIAMILSAVYLSYFLVGEVGDPSVKVKDLTFGIDRSVGPFSVRIKGASTLLAAFALVLLATVFAGVSSIMLCCNRDNFGCTLATLVLGFLCSACSFCYFAPVEIGPIEWNPDMTWGPGTNIGALINYFIAVIGCCQLLKSGDGSDAPLTNVEVTPSGYNGRHYENK